MTDTQSVTEDPKGSATGAAAADPGAPAESLDSLLAEFDQAAKQDGQAEATAAPVTESVDDSPEAVAKRLKALETERQRQRETETRAAVARDLATATATIQASLKDLPVQANERLVKGYLYQLADDNPAFLRAFGERHKDPAKWGKVLSAIAKEIRKDLGTVADPELSDARAAAVAAARGSAPGAAASGGQQWSRMTDAQFEEEKRKLRSG